MTLRGYQERKYPNLLMKGTKISTSDNSITGPQKQALIVSVTRNLSFKMYFSVTVCSDSNRKYPEVLTGGGKENCSPNLQT